MLQLEYTCTEAELREAQSLSVRQQLGKGSRLRTYLVLFAILLIAVLLFLFYVIKADMPPRDRLWLLALFVVIYPFFYFQQKRATKRALERPRKPSKLELTGGEVTILNDGLRVASPWSAFSECLESPNLFVLADKSKHYLVILPKRVFPDEGAQNWFRNQANQRPNAAAATVEMPVMLSAPAQPNGIVVNFQLGYRDYLNRTLISWRVKGAVLGMYVFFTVLFLYQLLAHPFPHRVYSPATIFFGFMLPIVTIVSAIMMLLMSFSAWFFDRRNLKPRQFAFSAERIDFADADGNGFIPWTTFKYWLENQWCFVVWNPEGPQWNMFPKRAFTSPAEIESCRALLQQNLIRSRWFFI